MVLYIPRPPPLPMPPTEPHPSELKQNIICVICGHPPIYCHGHTLPEESQIAIQISRDGHSAEIRIAECMCISNAFTPVCETCRGWRGSWHICKCLTPHPPYPPYTSCYGIHNNICSICFGCRSSSSSNIIIASNDIPELDHSGSDHAFRRQIQIIEFKSEYEDIQTRPSLIRSIIDEWISEFTDVNSNGIARIRIPVRTVSLFGPGQSITLLPVEVCMCEEPDGEPFCLTCNEWTGCHFSCMCGMFSIPGYESRLGIHDDLCRTCLGIIPDNDLPDLMSV